CKFLVFWSKCKVFCTPDECRTPGIMVWGIIGYDFSDILHPHVLPLLKQLLGTVFQQDNARPHTACVSMDCLRHEVLPWPVRSPDLSPIKRISSAYLPLRRCLKVYNSF
uniref:Tc1-like transposase DDE domain-containing protein n=1 Tax=Paramormyrops kingsleyae TaxID=1676925 RepID=A0A3B3QC69_9TELE